MGKRLGHHSRRRIAQRHPSRSGPFGPSLAKHVGRPVRPAGGDRSGDRRAGQPTPPPQSRRPARRARRHAAHDAHIQKGRGQKKFTHRPVPIPTSLAARLQLIMAGKPSNAALLVKPSGQPWERSDHSRLFKRVATRAGLDPAEVTLAALRHSSIVRQLLAAVPIRVVAVNHDTSVAMIERTYSKYIGDHADALARDALLDTSLPVATDGANVVPFGGRA